MQHLLRYANYLDVTRQFDEGTERLLEAVAISAQFAPDPDALYPNALHTIGSMYVRQNNLIDAQRYLQLALATGHPNWGEGRKERAITMGLLARVLIMSDQPAEALPHIEKTIAVLTGVYGPDHFLLSPAYTDYGRTLSLLGDYDGAETAVRTSLRITTRRYGAEHHIVARTLGTLATIMYEKKDYTEALALTAESLRLKRLTFDEDHPTMVFAHNRLASIELAMGDYEKSISSLDRSLAIQLANSGEDNMKVAHTLGLRAQAYAALGDIATAEADGIRALAIHSRVSPPRVHADALVAVAALLAEAQQCGKATGYVAQARAVRAAASLSDVDWARDAQARLGDCRT